VASPRPLKAAGRRWPRALQHLKVLWEVVILRIRGFADKWDQNVKW